jgi:hypothetical protein
VLAFGPAIVLLGAVQALTVALPDAGWPRWLWRPAGRLWAAVAPLSIAAVIGAIALLPGVANVLTWLALLTVPPLAAAALGWAARPATPRLALLSMPLFATAIAAQGHLVGDAAALALTALACVTLSRLVVGLAPLTLVKAGILAAALLDTTLIVLHKLQGPNAVLNAAAPAAHLPKLQLVQLGPAQMGFGDLFVAGLLGAALAAEQRRSGPAAIATFAFAATMDLLFYVTDELPATVPVALALIATELWAARRRTPRRRWRAPRARTGPPPRPGPGPPPCGA